MPCLLFRTLTSTFLIIIYSAWTKERGTCLPQTPSPAMTKASVARAVGIEHGSQPHQEPHPQPGTEPLPEHESGRPVMMAISAMPMSQQLPREGLMATPAVPMSPAISPRLPECPPSSVQPAIESERDTREETLSREVSMIQQFSGRSDQPASGPERMAGPAAPVSQSSSNNERGRSGAQIETKWKVTRLDPIQIMSRKEFLNRFISESIRRTFRQQVAKYDLAVEKLMLLMPEIARPRESYAMTLRILLPPSSVEPLLSAMNSRLSVACTYEEFLYFLGTFLVYSTLKFSPSEGEPFSKKNPSFLLLPMCMQNERFVELTNSIRPEYIGGIPPPELDVEGIADITEPFFKKSKELLFVLGSQKTTIDDNKADSKSHGCGQKKLDRSEKKAKTFGRSSDRVCDAATGAVLVSVYRARGHDMVSIVERLQKELLKGAGKRESGKVEHVFDIGYSGSENVVRLRKARVVSTSIVRDPKHPVRIVSKDPKFPDNVLHTLDNSEYVECEEEEESKSSNESGDPELDVEEELVPPDMTEDERTAVEVFEGLSLRGRGTFPKKKLEDVLRILGLPVSGNVPDLEERIMTAFSSESALQGSRWYRPAIRVFENSEKVYAIGATQYKSHQSTYGLAKFYSSHPETPEMARTLVYKRFRMPYAIVGRNTLWYQKTKSKAVQAVEKLLFDKVIPLTSVQRSADWLKLRYFRVTGTGAALVRSRNVRTVRDVCNALVKAWFRPGVSTEAMTIGHKNEDAICTMLKKHAPFIDVVEIGLVQHKTLPWLAVSADAVVHFPIQSLFEAAFDCDELFLTADVRDALESFGDTGYAPIEFKTGVADDPQTSIANLANMHPGLTFVHWGDDKFRTLVAHPHRLQILHQCAVLQSNFVFYSRALPLQSGQVSPDGFSVLVFIPDDVIVGHLNSLHDRCHILSILHADTGADFDRFRALLVENPSIEFLADSDLDAIRPIAAGSHNMVEIDEFVEYLAHHYEVWVAVDNHVKADDTESQYASRIPMGNLRFGVPVYYSLLHSGVDRSTQMYLNCEQHVKVELEGKCVIVELIGVFGNAFVLNRVNRARDGLDNGWKGLDGFRRRMNNLESYGMWRLECGLELISYHGVLKRSHLYGEKNQNHQGTQNASCDSDEEQTVEHEKLLEISNKAKKIKALRKKQIFFGSKDGVMLRVSKNIAHEVYNLSEVPRKSQKTSEEGEEEKVDTRDITGDAVEQVAREKKDTRKNCVVCSKTVNTYVDTDTGTTMATFSPNRPCRKRTKGSKSNFACRTCDVPLCLRTRCGGSISCFQRFHNDRDLYSEDPSTPAFCARQRSVSSIPDPIEPRPLNGEFDNLFEERQ